MSQLPFFKSDDIFIGPVRLLVKESHAIFTTIPRNGGLSKSDVINISRKYRSIIHECVENLSKDIVHQTTEQKKTFEQLEVLWNLCEILFLDFNETAPLIVLLKNWIRNRVEHLKPDTKIILNALNDDTYKFSENDDETVYWNLLVNLILVGDHRKALLLLKCHHKFDQSAQMQLVASMLDRMPHPNQYIVHEFVNRWATWVEWCKQELETGQFGEQPELLKIVKMFSKDLTVYDDVAMDCDTWYNLMVAYLLHTDPLIRETDLADLCRRTISIFKKNNQKDSSQEADSFDEIIISAFEYDLVQVIARSCNHLEDNWWFATHFIDLLHCSNQLRIHEIVEADKLRETFLKDYASSLFNDEYFWTIGVSYIDSCTSSGTNYLEALLSRVPLDINDEERANKIISISKKRNLHVLAKSVCIVMAKMWIAKSHRLDSEDVNKDEAKSVKMKTTKKTQLPAPINLSNAMYWAIRSESPAITIYVSDQYLLYYCSTGKFPDSSVFESIKRSPLQNDRLAFLCKYNEFKQLMMQNSEEDTPTEAGSLIRALLTSKLYPKFFRNQLIKDAKNLIEDCPQLVLQVDQILDLMKSIEETGKQTRADIDTEISKSLVKSMARALMTPIEG